MLIEYLNLNNCNPNQLPTGKFTLFIADLHLSADCPIVINKFLDFLNTVVIKAETLYILGDLFVIWAGDDDKRLLSQKIQATLRQIAKQGIKIFLMPGNRDFLLGEKFAKASCCELISDPRVIDLYGKRILLTHGDILCGKDSYYMRFRKFTRDPRRQLLFLRLPFFIRKWLALAIHGLSCLKGTIHSLDDLKNRVQLEAIVMMQKYGVDHIIHGHIHLPFMTETIVNGNVMHHMVLDMWVEKKEYSGFEVIMIAEGKN